MKLLEKKHSTLKLLLTVLFVIALLISNIVAGKQVQFPFGITMTGAIFIFPITYILSDIFSEVYGYGWSKATRYIGFIANLIMVGFFTLVINTKAPGYRGGQEAFAMVLGNTPRILFASLTAYLIGDYVNDKIFQKLKAKHLNDNKGFSFRAILSSFAGEIVDSSIFIPLAFLGMMPLPVLLTMGIVQVSLKVGYEIIILPLTTYFMKKTYKYEKKLTTSY